MCLYFLSQFGSGHSIVGGDVGCPLPNDDAVESRFVGVVVGVVVDDVVDREMASLPETATVVEVEEAEEEEVNKDTGVEIGGEFESLFRPLPALFPARPRFPLPFFAGEAETWPSAPLKLPALLLPLELDVVSAGAALEETAS